MPDNNVPLLKRSVSVVGSMLFGGSLTWIKPVDALPLGAVLLMRLHF
jgi:hypothetical protein